MEGYLKDVVKGFGERNKRLAIFVPLFQLKNRRKSSLLPENIDWFSLGLLTLLFFFECKLQRQGKKGGQELADYLFNLTSPVLRIARKDYDLIAQTIIDTFRDPTGRRQTESFYNWETGEKEVFQFAILKTDSFDQEGNRQYFTLAEAGLELIFATKEYFQEFRISIAQLLIRKQLEKGQFASALHEIHEMRVAVQTLRENIQRLGLEIARNIISEETYNKYAQIIEDAHNRLTMENEEFQELYAFAKETQEKINSFNYQEAEEEARLKITQVAWELNQVHQLHQSLLHDILKMKTKALEAARQALFSVGIQRFNFDQEIVSRIVSSPLPLEAVQGLAQPFLTLHKRRTWSLLSVFWPQRLGLGEREEESLIYPEGEVENTELFASLQEENFFLLMQEMLQIMGDKSSLTLQEMLPSFSSSWLHNRSFYDFWLLLHQRSPLGGNEYSDGSPLLTKALSLLKQEIIQVQEEKEILTLTNRYQLQNMRVTKEKNYGL